MKQDHLVIYGVRGASDGPQAFAEGVSTMEGVLRLFSCTKPAAALFLFPQQERERARSEYVQMLPSQGTEEVVSQLKNLKSTRWSIHSQVFLAVVSVQFILVLANWQRKHRKGVNSSLPPSQSRVQTPPSTSGPIGIDRK